MDLSDQLRGCSVVSTLVVLLGFLICFSIISIVCNGPLEGALAHIILGIDLTNSTIDDSK